MKTLQIFPRGDMVEFSGEYPHYVGTAGEFPPDEQKRIHAQVLAERWIEREIRACQSALVDELIKADHDGFGIDDIENVYRDFSEATLEECHEYLKDELGHMPRPNPFAWQTTRFDLDEILQDSGIELPDDESDETVRAAVVTGINNGTIDGLDEWREAANELAQDSPNEYYEWWLVSGWLCEQLRESGEIVIDNGYGQWWGRGCCGQSIDMDGTLQAIALRILAK